MNTGAKDQQLRELLEDTKALLSAAQSGDCDEIGRQLKKRQLCLDAIQSGGSVNDLQAESRKAIIGEIQLLDGEFCRKMRELTQKSSMAASDYQKKAVGVLKYNYGKYDLTSGQLVDKRN